ncbi:MAG: 50S ribosomal protein L35 [Chloroflexi bacterium]|nr:50S ribosomal protein L35 [Chloroflexota bacterium]
MPKLKTHKGAKRRLHVTGSGKIMRKKQGASHLRRKKPQRTKNAYEGKIELNPRDAKRVAPLINFYL